MYNIYIYTYNMKNNTQKPNSKQGAGRHINNYKAHELLTIDPTKMHVGPHLIGFRTHNASKWTNKDPNINSTKYKKSNKK